MIDTLDTIEHLATKDELVQTEIALEESLSQLDIMLSLSLDVGNETLSDSVLDMTGFVVSTEAAEDDAKIYEAKLDKLYKDVNNYIFRLFKKFNPLVAKSNTFKTSLLEKAIEDIEKGRLVPKDKPDQSKMDTLNNKLAPFYATGYKLENGCADLTTYITNIVDLTNRSGRYIKGLMDLGEKLKTSDVGKIPKLTGILNIKKELSGAKSLITRKRTITDFRLSVMDKWFGGGVSVTMLYGRREGGLKLGSDKFEVSTKQKVGTANNGQTIKLLQLGLSTGKQLDAIHASLGRTIKIMTRDNTMAFLDKNIDKSRRFLVARYDEAAVKVLINLYKDVYSIDDIILTYISKTYEKPKKK